MREIPDPTGLRLNLRFRAALRFHAQPIWAIAELAGVDPKDLDALVNEKRTPVKDDPVILPVAKLLGFGPDACFIEDEPEPGEQ
jgi:hypothetical protein